MAKFMDSLKHAWSVFSSDDSERIKSYGDYGSSYGFQPYANRMSIANDKSIVTSIYTRIGIDVAAVKMQHVRVDEDDTYIETVKSGLNECLTSEANMDQAARAFRQDIAMTLFDEGVIAIVPVDTTINPKLSGSWDIKSLRVGKIVAWYPQHVQIDLYNEKIGKKQQVVLPKNQVAIVENPLYSVMNEPNSTLQRLMRKLGLLDSIDEQVGSGKLDMIIQLPYVIKNEAKRAQAEMRRNDIEMQLKGSKYGIAYTDGTERITQLNRPAENNMLKQVEYLTAMLYAQLGLTEEIFNGTADEKMMLNYHNRTIEPILTAITEAMNRTFLTKTARSRGHKIQCFRDPFKSVAIADMAEIADKFTRNEILSSNEVRSAIGMRPSKDKKADELRNKNVPAEAEPSPPPATPKEES